MTFRVTFLGTSGAVPTTERNPSGILVNREGERFLLDVGEGTQRQMMRFGTGFTVSKVLISHLHSDHILGLPGLLETWEFMDRTAPVEIFTPSGTVDELRRFLFTLRDPPDYDVRLRPVEDDTTLVETDEYTLRAFQTEHRTRSVGYALVEADRKGRFDRERAEALGVPVGPLFSKLHAGESVELEDGTVVASEEVVGEPRPGRRLVYTGDTRPTDRTVTAASEADLLIHDGTFTERLADRARATAHSTAAEAAEVASRANAQRLALVHISSRYPGAPTEHRKEAEEHFDGEVLVPDDGQSVSLPYPEG